MEIRIREYLRHLLAKAHDGDVKNEIIDELCGNLCEKYNDLLQNGVAPEDAYRQVAESIGDVSEIISFINVNTQEAQEKDFDFSSSFQGFEKHVRQLAKALEGPLRDVANDFKNAAINAKEPLRNMAGQVAQEFKNVVKNIDFSMPSHNNYRYDYTVAAEDLDTLDIQLSSGNVIFGLSEDENIYVVELSASQLSEENRAGIFKDGTTLHISQGKGGSSGHIFFSCGIISSDFEIYLPQRLWRAINIRTSNGRVDLDSGLAVSNLFARTTSGDILCAASEMDNCVLTSVSGNIEVSGALQLADIKTTSGDMELSGDIRQLVLKTVSGDIETRLSSLPDTCEAESVSGDVKLMIPENDGFTIQYKRVSGDLRSDFNLMTSLNSKSGFAVYRNGDAHTYQLSTVSGDIKILRR